MEDQMIVDSSTHKRKRSEMEIDDFRYFCIQIITSIPNPLDAIIINNLLSFDEKMYLIDNVLKLANDYYPNNNLGITPKTISLFLQIKKENDMYLDCFRKLMNFCLSHHLNGFTHNHIYHLVLQIWMDFPNNVVSNDFRKKIIAIGIKGQFKESIFNQIKMNIDIWFCNIGKNPDVTELIDWICSLDKTGQLSNFKLQYERREKEKMENTKMFRKKYEMMLYEHEIQQQIAKKNGLCKYIREGKECPRKSECIFYHGRVEETYGIQPCKHGEKCNHLRKGECKFVHKPSSEQIAEIRKFYYGLKRLTNTNIFLVERNRSYYVDRQSLTNPFIVLKKTGITNKYVHYQIPNCAYQFENEYGMKNACGNPVRFVTKKDGKLSNFYCCYEHMNAIEPGCPYLVKQNILDQIFVKDS